MSSKVIKLVMEDGSSFDYKEKTINQFLKTEKNEVWAKRWFNEQHNEWQKEAMSYFTFDLEDYAKEKFDLIDSDDQKEIEDFEDVEILEEADYRGILPSVAEVHNQNILNEDFVDRFVTIINRGNTLEIESALSFLEFKFKIQ